MTNISHIDHIAIVVNSIEEARKFYEDTLGLLIDQIEEMPNRGIKTAFITLGQTKIELIEPLCKTSEVSKFLEKKGPGIHHIAFSVNNISQKQQKIKDHLGKLIYNEAQDGAHNTKINFIHPKSSHGVLIELVEKK